MGAACCSDVGVDVVEKGEFLVGLEGRGVILSKRRDTAGGFGSATRCHGVGGSRRLR